MEHTITHDGVSCDTTTTFNELWSRYRAKIFVRLLTLTHNRETAEDLTQETYLRAWRYLPTLKNEKNLYGWLYLMASRLAYSWNLHEHGEGCARHEAPTSLDLTDDEGYSLFDITDERYDPERAACEKELMLTALARINPQARERLISHFIHGRVVEPAEQLWDDRHQLKNIYKRLERGLKQTGPKQGARKKGRAA
jgi:RNA polymerase sigma factor (sigma-70 family)